VVGNTQDGGLDARPRLVVFAPFAQEFAIAGGLVVRTQGDASRLAAAATRVVQRIAPMTVAQIKDQSVSPRRLNAILVSSFGLLALVIAAIGIGGVLAFSVGSRTNEIGIRMSLGAQRAQVQRMILREGGSMVLLGLVIGIGAAYYAVRLLRGMLFGVEPHDPVTFGAVALIMAAIGIAACWIPARRASRIDPVIAMR
jgi:ABC-type antimicrobial peptide transport system permease subunit